MTTKDHDKLTLYYSRGIAVFEDVVAIIHYYK